MRAMKDSGIEWVGAIPQNWEVKKLKYCTDLRLEKTNDKESFAPYIGLEHVSSNTGTLCDDYETITDFKGETLDFYTGDVLFGKLRPYLAKAYHAKMNGRCSSEFWVMNPRGIEGRFLLYYVLSHGFITDIDHSTYGVKMPRAEWGYAGNSKIPFPPEKEQAQITDFLDAKCAEVDSLIAAKEKTNALLKERRQSLIYEAVTKGLDPTAPMKDSGIEWLGKIPKNWKIYRLKHILASEKGAIKAGPFGSSLNAVDMQGSDVKVFNQRTVLDNDFEKGDEYVSFEKYEELTGFTVASGDILITTRGTIGKTAIVQEGKSGILHPCLIKMTVDSTVFSKRLLCRVFNETNILSEQLRLASNATTIDVIYTQNLLNLFFAVPPMKEQEEILRFTDDECGKLDSIIRNNESTIKRLKEYRQSLIYEAVTGKKEV